MNYITPLNSSVAPSAGLSDWASGSSFFNSTGSLGAGNSAAGMNMTEMFGKVAPILAIGGALQSGIGAYFSAKSTKQNLEFQSQMSEINARSAEHQAQNILMAGERQAGQVSMKYGQIKGAAKARLAANGIQAGVGSAAEVIASTDLMKETDMLTINANTVRAAWAARTQATNYSNQSLLQGASADSISPFMAASTNLMSSASSVLPSWYRNTKLDNLLARLG